MKQQEIQYVALDVHQATLVVSVRDAQGAVVMRSTVATEAKTIVGLIRGLGGRVHVAFEEGTQAQWLHDVLEPHAELVVVCNIRGRARPATRVIGAMPIVCRNCCALGRSSRFTTARAGC